MAELVTGPNPAFAQAFQPQGPDPLQRYAQLAQLKNALAEAPIRQQILQQQAQQGQLDIQKEQQAQRDQQAMTKALQVWDGKDYEGLAQAAIKSGASANAVMGIRKTALENQEKLSTIFKNNGQGAKAQFETQKGNNDFIAGQISAVQSAPDDQLPQVLTQTAQQLAQSGKIDPQHAQQAIQLAQSGMPAAQLRQSLDTFKKFYQADSTQAENAYKQAQLANQQQERAQAAANANETADYHNREIATRKAQLGIEAGRLALEKQKANLDQSQYGLTGDAFLQTLPPGLQAQVKATASGDIAIPPPSARNPQAQQIRMAVLSYDPTYTDARYKGKQDFKNKGDAQNIVQLSTAMEHADRATQNSAAIGTAPALGNKTFESPKSAAYMQDVEFLTGEVGKLVKNGVLTVDEGNKISSGLTSFRQSVRDSALNETMDLLGGKTRAMFQKYKTGTGQDLPLNEFFDPKTQQRLVKYGIVEGTPQAAQAPQSGGGLSVVAPNGKTYTFKDQASADAFKQKAGIQ